MVYIFREINREQEKEYWIDGVFIEFWGGRSYYSHDRDIFIPKGVTVKVEPNRIYINKAYAEARKLAYKTKVLDMTNKQDLYLMSFVKMLNVPWVKEYNPPFEVSL